MKILPIILFCAVFALSSTATMVEAANFWTNWTVYQGSANLSYYAYNSAFGRDLLHYNIWYYSFWRWDTGIDYPAVMNFTGGTNLTVWLGAGEYPGIELNWNGTQSNVVYFVTGRATCLDGICNLGDGYTMEILANNVLKDTKWIWTGAAGSVPFYDFNVNVGMVTAGQNITIRFYNTGVNSSAYDSFNVTNLKVSLDYTPPVSFKIDNFYKLNYTEGEIANITTQLNNSFANDVTATFTYNLSIPYSANQITTEVFNNISYGLTNFSKLFTLAANNNTVGAFQFQNLSVSINLTNATNNAANISTANLSVYPIIITNCIWLSTAETMRMSVFDESDFGDLDNSFIELVSVASPVTNTMFTRAYNFTLFTGESNDASICIYPQWATYTLDNTIVYYCTDYVQRSAYSYGNFSNVTQNMSFYLSNTGAAEQVIIYVVDESGNRVEGVTVKAQRWYVGNNTYSTVASIKTDFEGKGSTYLVIPDVYYRFILEVNGTVRSTTSPTIIICKSGTCPPYLLTLSLSTAQISPYFERIGTVYWLCSYINTTNTTTCTVSDLSGVDVAANLTVKKLTTTGWQTVCSSETIGTSVTLVCPLGVTTNSLYQYFLYAKTTAGNYDLLETDTLDFTGQNVSWGQAGLLGGLILFLVMIGIGAFNPIAMIVFGFAAIVAGQMLGIMPVSISALVGLGAVVAFAAYKMRS